MGGRGAGGCTGTAPLILNLNATAVPLKHKILLQGQNRSRNTLLPYECHRYLSPTEIIFPSINA